MCGFRENRPYSACKRRCIGGLTFVVHLPVAVDIRLPDHLVDLLVGKLFAEICHDVPELGRRYEAVAVLVEHPEGLPDLLLAVRVLHLARHHGQELGEVDRTVACRSEM